MNLRFKLLQAIFVGFVATTFTVSSVEAWAQNATSTKKSSTVKKSQSSKPKKVRSTTTRSKSEASEERRPSFAAAMGLRGKHDELNLKSSVALIIDRQTHEVLFEKNSHAALPIASITKLMTSLVVLDAQLPFDESIVIHQDDVNVYPGRTRSRVTEGARMTREQALILALMSSENRAAHALGRNYPGGIPAFVDAMNAKARLLGMTQSKFADPTGLSSDNVSSPEDLTKLVEAAYQHRSLREFSTKPDYNIMIGKREQKFINTNRLVRASDMDIGLQKTGYISAAGRCLVMQARVVGRDVVMVFLDSVGAQSRFADAVRVRQWLEANPSPQPLRRL